MSVRVQLVKLGVLTALVTAVVAQTASAHVLTALPTAVEATPAPVVTLSPAVGEVVAVPDTWSFDDAHPGVATAALTGRPGPTRAPVAERKPPRPPARAASGALPASGTPQAVLAAAYVRAAAGAPRGCHLRVAHLAAIGQVESGSVGGRSITADHRVSPAIYGPLLDGGPFAVVHDTDGGSYDGAGDFDRAVGPLQFLPGTWRWAGRDGDGDGRRDPQNVYDAAAATADYLCRDGRDLSRAGDLRAAILTYNWSGEYVAAVSQWVSFFTRHGLAPLTDVAFRVGSGGRASDLAAATSKDAKDAKDAKEAKAGKPAKAKARATAKPARPTGAGGTGTPTGAPRPTTTATPTPSPTTTAPDPATPEPSATTPVPSPSTPDPVVTTPPPTEPSGGATTPSTG